MNEQVHPRGAWVKRLFLLVCLAAAGFVIYVCAAFHLNSSLLMTRAPRSFNSGWYAAQSDGRRAVQAVPRSRTAESGALVLENRLPDIPGDGIVLCFQSGGEDVSVKIGVQTVYVYGQQESVPFGRNFGPVWHMVPLSSTDSGRKITLTLTARPGRAAGNYCFYLDHRAAIVNMLLTSNLPLLANALVLMVCALYLIGASLYRLARRLEFAWARLYLGLLALMVTMWALTQTNLDQLVQRSRAVGYMVNYTSFGLMPATFSLFLSEMLSERASRALQGMAVAFMAAFAASMALFALDLCSPEALLPVEYGLIALLAAVACALCFGNRKAVAGGFTLAGTAAFSLSAILALVWAHPAIGGRAELIRPCDLVLAGMDVLVLSFYAAMNRYNLSLALNARQFRRQAYIDAMTNVYNRAALEERLDELERRPEGDLTLFMIDLNNLKIVNDNLGHDQGDDLILGLTECLKEAFGDSGVLYRYGGDEFVVLMEGADAAQAANVRRRLLETIEAHNKDAACPIDAAVGASSRAPGDPAAARMLLRRADAAMYAEKLERKAAGQPLQGPQQQIDPLTGLMTFPSFCLRLYALVKLQPRRPMAILSFDMNCFDGYNTLFGWEAGDRMLQRLARLATALCGDGGFCGRGDADTFWAVTDYADPQAVHRRIERESRAFERQGDTRMFLSFGIYEIADLNLSVGEMCHRASLAKKTVKGRFDRLYARYDSGEHPLKTDRMRLMDDLRPRLAKDEFQPWVQPLFSPDGKALLGGEALVRWVHPDGSISLPGEFLDLFEKSGLLLSLDETMFTRVCADQRRRMDAGLNPVPVGVNLSRLHAYSRQSAARFRAILDEHRVPADLIRIELKESAFIEDAAAMLQFVGELHQQGFKVTMDDFGCELTTLGALRTLPADVIKLDRSFLTEDQLDLLSQDILKLAVDVCRRANIRVIAEGVETAGQLDCLARLGCCAIQGDYFSPALTVEDYDALLRKNAK